MQSPAAAFAQLPEGVKSPSTQSEPFELYEKLIEQRTGQAEALPELVEAPKVSDPLYPYSSTIPLQPAAARLLTGFQT